MTAEICNRSCNFCKFPGNLSRFFCFAISYMWLSRDRGGERKYRRTLRSIGSAKGEGEEGRRQEKKKKARGRASENISSERTRQVPRRSSLNGSANQLAPGTRPITDFFLAVYIPTARRNAETIPERHSSRWSRCIWKTQVPLTHTHTSTCELGDGGRRRKEGRRRAMPID